MLVWWSVMHGPLNLGVMSATAGTLHTIPYALSPLAGYATASLIIVVSPSNSLTVIYLSFCLSCLRLLLRSHNCICCFCLLAPHLPTSELQAKGSDNARVGQLQCRSPRPGLLCSPCARRTRPSSSRYDLIAVRPSNCYICQHSCPAQITRASNRG